jgi:CubicO group peptidase (beta-lactamase class C family)
MRVRTMSLCRHGVFAFLIFILATSQLVAQAPASASKPALPTAAPESVGLSSERLERITRATQKAIDEGRLAGGLTLVARHGKIAYFKAMGDADREAKIPMRTDHIFRICSMTKPITNTAVMMLYEDGRFMLNQPVSDFIPEFKNMKVLDPPAPQDRTSPAGALVDAKRPITIRHLLTHTSGLAYQNNVRVGKLYRDAGIDGGITLHKDTVGDAMKKLAAQPLLFQPGDAWEYGLSIDLLGYLVEVVSGKPLDQFLRERLFEPLGMKDTAFFVPKEKAARFPRAYSFFPGKRLEPILDGQLLDDENSAYTADYPYNAPGTYFSGGGGLTSTPGDYFRFCQMMLNVGQLNGTRILSRKTVELMTQDHVQGKRADGGFGLGFGVISEPRFLTELGSIGTYDWAGFYYTRFIIDPKEDMIVIFMSQLHPDNGLDLDRKVIRLAYAAIQD